MIFIENLEDKLEIRIIDAYGKILGIKHLQKIPGGKTLNCNSFRKIAADITIARNEGLEKKLSDLEIVNTIIYKLLIGKYFVHYNYKMALIIGYIFLKMHNITVNNFSMGKISDDSTLDEIKALTASW